MFTRHPHELGKPKKGGLPKHIIFYDTETYDEPQSATSKKLRLRLGVAQYCDVTDAGDIIRRDLFTFRDADDFNRYLLSKTSQRKRLIVVAHNIGFDVRITATFKFLADNGWDRTLLINEGLNFIATFKKHDAGIRFINNQQLFPLSLRKLGESIGEYKARVDFAAATDDELESYCRQDVQVMVVAWQKWLRFVVSNDLGAFKITAASQALGAYRHRFYDTPVHIHTNQKAIDLERGSYHGGRVECFFIGEYTGGRIYSLDINSMYPHVMREPVPVKLVRYYRYTTIPEFRYLAKKYGYVVEATLQITEPCLPVVSPTGKLVFPTGRVSGAFTKPELEYALQRGTLISVRKLALYREEPIFQSYVDFFYKARQKYKDEGNPAFAYLSKLMLNSLYGKFGQSQLEYIRIGFKKEIPDGIYKAVIDASGQLRKIRILDGIIERESGRREAYNAFPAIASYITARARIHLDSLIERAGRGQVLYCDTDSLFVTESGYRNLLGEIDNAVLGKLKLEGVEDSMTIRAPKHYRFGDKVVQKGIRVDALEIAPSVWEQDKFVSFKGSMRAHDTNSVVIERIVKRVSDNYTKGIVSPSGHVIPFDSPQFPTLTQ